MDGAGQSCMTPSVAVGLSLVSYKDHRGAGAKPYEQFGDLLARCACKDETAFTQLYRLSAPRLLAVARRITKRTDLAEDVLQESFVNIWHHAGDYDSRRSAPMTWMTAIVRHRAVDWMRLPRNAESNDLQEDLLASLPDEAPGPEDLLRQAKDASRIAACLQRLGEHQQRAIMLAFLYGMSHAEISANLRQPLGTVKTWIRRGLEQLRRCLEEQQAKAAHGQLRSGPGSSTRVGMGPVTMTVTKLCG
jgi:RNA polymerase sigma-70 factor (ECF subfamily)